MITFLVKKGHEYTLTPYLNSEWTMEFKGRIRVLNYTQLNLLADRPSHLIAFLDHERFTAGERVTLIKIWKYLKEKHPQLTIWNEPGKVLNRLELIQSLNRKKINQFNAYRINADLSQIRFPVFLRSSSYHNGSLTGLIYNASDLLSEIRRLTFPRNKYVATDLLIVEFCDISQDHNYIRYSALRMNGIEIPMLMDVSRDWVVKTDLRTYDYEFCQEVLKFFRTNPHKEWMPGIFNTANIDYGRVDYSLKGDKPQVWEINSNPIIQWSESKMAKIKENLSPSVIKCLNEFKQIVNSGISDQFREILNREPVQINRSLSYSNILLHASYRREKIEKKVRFAVAGLYGKIKFRL